jgi:telomere length regulation protein
LSLNPINQRQADSVPSIAYLLAKLVGLGVFPATPSILRSQPSFFETNLATIRTRLESSELAKYSEFWTSLLQGLPSSMALQSVLRSLFASLHSLDYVADSGPLERARVKREARLLAGLTGPLTPEKEELWESALAIMLGRDWDIGYARIFVCWISGGPLRGKIDAKGWNNPSEFYSWSAADLRSSALDALLNNVLEMWSSQDHIKHSLLSRHQCMSP